MKILKYGEGYHKTVTCDNCNSELEYDSNDIETIDTERKNIVENTIIGCRHAHINCPVCKHWIDVGSILLYERKELTEPSESKKRWWQI